MDVFLGVRLDNKVPREDVLRSLRLHRVTGKRLLCQGESLLVSLVFARQFEFVEVALNDLLLDFLRHVGDHAFILFEFWRHVIWRGTCSLTLKIVNVQVLTADRVDSLDVHLEFNSFGFEMLPLSRVDFRINLQTRKRIGKHGVEVLVSVLYLHLKNIIVIEIL